MASGSCCAPTPGRTPPCWPRRWPPTTSISPAGCPGLRSRPPPSRSTTSSRAAVDHFGQATADYAITLADDDAHPYVGGCGLIDRVGPGGREIGYWLDAAHTGRGLVTEAAALLTAAALALDGVDRVEIHCDQANHRSAAVPARLGYRLDRIEADEVRTPAESGHSMIWVFDALACQGASHG